MAIFLQTILQSWNATDPVFDSCFENIIFTVSPCFVFWILGLAEIPVIVKKKPPPIIHHKLMTAKMVSKLPKLKNFIRTHKFHLESNVAHVI